MAPPDFAAIARVLIAEGRSYHVDFLSAFDVTPGGKRPRDVQTVAQAIAETIVAFANSDGGDLLVGVEASGHVSGVPFDRDALLYLGRAPEMLVESPDFGVRVHEIELDGRTLLLFRVVATSTTIAVTADGKCLWRKDDTNRPVAPHEIERRRNEHRGDTHYEAEPVPRATLDDLAFPDHPRVRELMNMFGGEREHLLRYWNLSEGRNGHLVLKRAALLLFAREPLRWHPNNRVRLRRILGDDPGYGANKRTRETELLGPIVPLLASARAALREALAVERRTGDLFAVAAVLPEEAVDECLVNALVHRNYAVEGNAIEILVYPDRLEFLSPGGLPKPLTINDLKRRNGAHRARNPLLMRVLRDLRETRDEGEGMRRIFGAMSQVELHEPELEERADTFIIRLSTRSRYSEETQAWLASYGPYGLMPNQRKYVTALAAAKDSQLSVDKLARQLGESFDVTSDALAKLEELGIVWHKAKTRVYHLVQPLSVPHERLFRRIAASSSGDLERTYTIEELSLLLQVPGLGVKRSLDRFKDSGIIESDEQGRWRFGPSLREYIAQRDT